MSFCTGSDYYKFNYNWVCGNMSTGDGGGVAHLGFSFNGDIEHNSILFNQSLNPTIITNGGGLDHDGHSPMPTLFAAPWPMRTAFARIQPRTASGPDLAINANLIHGQLRPKQDRGGGIRLQGVNGTDVTSFPTTPPRWYPPMVTNNIIVNNVAGWDGGGVRCRMLWQSTFVNNTIASNDTHRHSRSAVQHPGCRWPARRTMRHDRPATPTNAGNTSLPQPAGLVSHAEQHPADRGSDRHQAHLPGQTSPNCAIVLQNPYPIGQQHLLENRSFYVGVGGGRMHSTSRTS